MPYDGHFSPNRGSNPSFPQHNSLSHTHTQHTPRPLQNLVNRPSVFLKQVLWGFVVAGGGGSLSSLNTWCCCAKVIPKVSLRKTVEEGKSRQSGGFMGLGRQAWCRLTNTKDAEESENQRRLQVSAAQDRLASEIYFRSFFICFYFIVKLGWAKFSPFQGCCIDCCRIYGTDTLFFFRGPFMPSVSPPLS